jgi:hypothetical protein
MAVRLRWTEFAAGDAIAVSKNFRYCVLFAELRVDVVNAGPNPKTAVTFAITSTKNPLDHLRLKHDIGPDGPINRAKPPRHQQTIEAAFGEKRPEITFNADIFERLLGRWIYTEDVSFRSCETESFRYLLSYLAACVSNIFFLNASGSWLTTSPGRNPITPLFTIHCPAAAIPCVAISFHSTRR